MKEKKLMNAWDTKFEMTDFVYAGGGIGVFELGRQLTLEEQEFADLILSFTIGGNHLMTKEQRDESTRFKLQFPTQVDYNMIEDLIIETPSMEPCRLLECWLALVTFNLDSQQLDKIATGSLKVGLTCMDGEKKILLCN
jgi:hypothetical protein